MNKRVKMYCSTIIWECDPLSALNNNDRKNAKKIQKIFLLTAKAYRKNV